MSDETKKPKPKAKPKVIKPIFDYDDFYKANEDDVLTMAVRLGFMATPEGMTLQRKKSIIDYLIAAKELVENKKAGE